jgi:hypothetical protein
MKSRRWALILVCAVLAAAGARAQNLLVNPNFDADTSGWNTFQGMIFDETRDQAGDPPGSGQHSSQGTFCSHTTQCVNVTPGATYSLTGFLLFPSGQGFNTGPGTAAIFMGFYDAVCGSNSLFLVGAPPITNLPNSSPAETWLPQSQSFVAPFNALSASIVLEICQQQAQTDVTANFDTLVFEEIAAAAIPTLGQTGACLLAGLLAAAGILAVRSRSH